MNAVDQLQAAVQTCLCAIINERRAPQKASHGVVSGLYRMWASPATIVSINAPPPVEAGILFQDLKLGLVCPEEICEALSLRLRIPEIPFTIKRQIITTYEIQDSIPPLNKHARSELTLVAFAEKVAKWLYHQHSNIRVTWPLTDTP